MSPAIAGVVIAFAITAMLAGRAEAHHRVTCPPPNVRVLARTSSAIVYTPGSVRPNAELLGCRPGEQRQRDLLEFNDGWSPPIAMAGPLTAFVDSRVDDNQNGTVDIPILDLRRSRPADDPLLTITWGKQGKIGSLVVTRRGGIAFISCSLDATFGPFDARLSGRPRPQCISPGRSPSSVLKRDSTAPDNANPVTQLQRLDSSLAIDPTSLRLRGHQLSWISDGERRTSTLR